MLPIIWKRLAFMLIILTTLASTLLYMSRTYEYSTIIKTFTETERYLTDLTGSNYGTDTRVVLTHAPSFLMNVFIYCMAINLVWCFCLWFWWIFAIRKPLCTKCSLKENSNEEKYPNVDRELLGYLSVAALTQDRSQGLLRDMKCRGDSWLASHREGMSDDTKAIVLSATLRAILRHTASEIYFYSIVGEQTEMYANHKKIKNLSLLND